MHRRLGKTQEKVLAAIRRYGEWHDRGCGWVWDNNSGTRKILESLVRQGLVVKVTTFLNGSKRDTYRPH